MDGGGRGGEGNEGGKGEGRSSCNPNDSILTLSYFAATKGEAEGVGDKKGGEK